VRPGAGHEQHGVLYGVVVASDALAALSTILVAPPSRSARGASFRPEIDVDGSPSKVLVEPDRRGRRESARRPGRLTAEELWGVDLALATVFDLR